MSTSAKATAQPLCPVPMSAGKPCGRPLHTIKHGDDEEPVCLMHSRDPEKDKALFRQEIDAILAGKTKYNRPKDTFDFTRFVFPEANFLGAKFTQNARFIGAIFTQDADFSHATFTHYADFSEATFTQHANFTGATFTQDAPFLLATFTQNADFIGATFTGNASFTLATFTQDASFLQATFTQNASFIGATFTQHASFLRATFTQHADFSYATFTQDADFRSATFTERGHFFLTSFRQVANFRDATFEKPNRILFHRVNEKPPPGMTDPVGLKARFLNCLLDGVRFEDVHWHTPGGRLVLQDELDLEGKSPLPPTHELVADAYRRLVNNFEKARQYELAEQCIVGEMEMRRRNPDKFLFASWRQPSRFFQKARKLPFLGPLLRSIARVPRSIGRFCYKTYSRVTPKRGRFADYKRHMKRLSTLSLTWPGMTVLGWLIKQFYRLRGWWQRCNVFRWLGEHVSALYFYRLFSMYGSSYRRALGWLAAFLVVAFPILFGLFGLRMSETAQPHQATYPISIAANPSEISLWEAWHAPNRCRELWQTYKAGLLASLEVATFQRNASIVPATTRGRGVAVVEVIVVPGQLALFLFALRRRFRR